MPEYEDYRQKPSVRSASEFISCCMEDNLLNLYGNKTYADYIATRPRAEKIGSHGLFSDEGREIILSKVDEELNNYSGRVFTFIVSLRREDAVRLGFDHAQSWMDMLRAHTGEVADAIRVPYINLRWYAAFHNEGTHPHVHLMAYSANPKEGYLSNKGIESLRSSLANDIFADELHNIFAEQTNIRDILKKDWKELVMEHISALDTSTNPHTEMKEKLILLAEKLRNTKGKKIYGYLKKDVKDLIDSIVDLMANDENIAKLYDMWWEKKCEVLKTYYQNIPYEKPPLSQNKEFKSLKNDIIREAMKIGGYLDAGQEIGCEKNSPNKKKNSRTHSYSPQTHKVTATAVTGLLRSLAGIFSDKIQKEDKKIYRADRRQEREEEQKRNAEFDMIM